MEMRCTALSIFRGARAAVGQTLRSHCGVVTRRGIPEAVFVGTLHYACLLPHCVVRCVALSLTTEKKTQGKLRCYYKGQIFTSCHEHPRYVASRHVFIFCHYPPSLQSTQAS